MEHTNLEEIVKEYIKRKKKDKNKRLKTVRSN